jgi:RHS repeat-associated protein
LIGEISTFRAFLPYNFNLLRYYYELAGSTVTKYYFAGTQRVATPALAPGASVRKYTIPQSMTVEYFLGDHLGSTSLTTDANGAKVSEMRYKPCPLRYTSGVLRKGEPRYTWTSAPATTPAYKLPSYTFTGQYSYMDDPTTAAVTEGFGLMFYNARWYAPYLNHFTQPDSIVPLDSQGTQAWDRYAFVNNNPVRYNDPTGHMITDGCSGDREGCSITQYQKDLDAQKLAILEAQARARKCSSGNRDYCSGWDNWAWENIPSAMIYHKGIYVQGGFGGEFGSYREVGYVFNWRSFEFDRMYTQG